MTSRQLRTRSTASRARVWKIHCTFESQTLDVSAREVRDLLRATLALVEDEVHPHTVNEIHVLITDDESIRLLNAEHRQKDKPTDVLSFPQLEPDEVRGSVECQGPTPTYLGDLVISSDTTLRQAKRFAVTPRQEFLRLIVHGVLHLCGYDHENVSSAEAQRMRRRERTLRERLSSFTSPTRPARKVIRKKGVKAARTTRKRSRG